MSAELTKENSVPARLSKENTVPARLSQSRESSDDDEAQRPPFRRSSHTWPKVTREEWRSIANLEI